MLAIKEGSLWLHLDCVYDSDLPYAESGYCVDRAGFQRDLTDDELTDINNTYCQEIYEHVMSSGEDLDSQYDLDKDGGQYA